MPLYNNILHPKKSDGSDSKDAATINLGTDTTSASMKFLQDHLKSKKRSKQSSGFQQKSTTRAYDVKSSSDNTLPIRRFCGEPCDWYPQDEYDPLAPNSYEILQADYLRAEEQKLIAAKKTRHTDSKRIDTSLLDVIDNLSEIETGLERPIRGTAIAPPSTLQAPATTTSTNLNSEKSNSIVASENETRQPSPQQPEPDKHQEKKSSTRDGIESCGQLSKPNEDHTRVVLLQNMVGPGEVDDDLEAETKEECSKYGEVVRCLIYEIPNKRVPDDQAVRIFVEFGTIEAAQKASDDLNGRYFGGRVVKATFYDVDQFNRYDLGQ